MFDDLIVILESGDSSDEILYVFIFVCYDVFFFLPEIPTKRWAGSWRNGL